MAFAASQQTGIESENELSFQPLRARIREALSHTFSDNDSGLMMQ